MSSKESLFFPDFTTSSGKTRFMPFRDFTLDVAGRDKGGLDLIDVYKATGLKYFTLAFVNLNSWDVAAQEPSWAGSLADFMKILPGKENFRENQVKELRAVGGDISISFGGAFGQHEPAIDIIDIDQLVACYQKVVTAYNLKYVDWDIEGGEVLNVEANIRRAKAIKKLVEANPGLEISMTLPVNSEGLAAGGLALLKTLKDNDAPLTVLNGMSMEFGWYYKGGDLSKTIIDSCNGLEAQADAMGWSNSLLFGTTPMIGQSYARAEVVYPADYVRICQYLKSNPRQFWLGFWSIDRDNGKGGRNEFATYDRSGLEIEDFEFTKTCLLELKGTLENPMPLPPGSEPVPPTEPVPVPPTEPVPVPPTEPIPVPPTEPIPPPTIPPPDQPYYGKRQFCLLIERYRLRYPDWSELDRSEVIYHLGKVEISDGSKSKDVLITLSNPKLVELIDTICPEYRLPPSIPPPTTPPPTEPAPPGSGTKYFEWIDVALIISTGIFFLS